LLFYKKAINVYLYLLKATHEFLMIKSLLQQFKERRLALGLIQKDMMLRVGVSRQQYQQLESKGNPRLNTIELIAKGLNSELMLIPAEKQSMIEAILTSNERSEENTLANDPWKGLLESDE